MRGGVRETGGSARGRLWWAGLAFGVVLAYGLLLARFGLDLVDEGTLLAQFDRVQRGEIPYRDFHTGYGPGAFVVNALLFRLVGTDVVTVRVGLALVHALAAALVVWLALPIAGRSLTLVVLALLWTFFRPIASGAFAVSNIPYPAWYAEMLGYAALVVLAGEPSPGARRLATTGMLWGAAAVFKQNAGVLGLAGSLVYLALSGEQGRDGGTSALGLLLAATMLLGLVLLARQAAMSPYELGLYGALLLPLAVAVVRARPGPPLLRRGLLLAAGFAAVVVPVTLALAQQAGAAAVREGLLHVGSGAAEVFRVPYPSPRGVVDALAAVPTGGLPALRVFGEAVWLILLPLGSLLGTLELARAPARRSPAWRLVTCVGTLWYLQMFPRSDFWHVLPVAAPLLVVVAGLLRGMAADRRARVLLAALGLVAAVGRGLPTLPEVLRCAGTPPAGTATVERASIRWDLVRPEYLRRVPEVVAALRGARSLVGFPALAFFNFAAAAPSPIREDYFFPGVPSGDALTRAHAAVAAAPPEAVVEFTGELAFFDAARRAHGATRAILWQDRARSTEVGPYRIGWRTGP